MSPDSYTDPLVSRHPCAAALHIPISSGQTSYSLVLLPSQFTLTGHVSSVQELKDELDSGSFEDEQRQKMEEDWVVGLQSMEMEDDAELDFQMELEQELGRPYKSAREAAADMLQASRMLACRFCGAHLTVCAEAHAEWQESMAHCSHGAPTCSVRSSDQDGSSAQQRCCSGASCTCSRPGWSP